VHGEDGVHEGARVADLLARHAAEERALLRPLGGADRRVEELAPGEVVDRALAGGDAFFRGARFRFGEEALVGEGTRPRRLLAVLVGEEEGVGVGGGRAAVRGRFVALGGRKGGHDARA
jgi:hypothetical protein